MRSCRPIRYSRTAVKFGLGSVMGGVGLALAMRMARSLASPYAPLYFAASCRPQPALRVSASPDRPVLLDFDFVDAALPWRSGCTWLAGARREAWVPADGDLASIGLQRSLQPGEDVALAAESIYRELIAAVRPGAHPYLIRIWNYLGAINEGAGDDERYRRFCVGRDKAVDAMFRDPPPAATAIGTPDADAPLTVVALCSARPGIALENPRQTPAWAYPREYGPVSPGFSRGAVLHDADGAVLLASGTASIVGHVSLHPGDVLGQLDETLRNLDVLLAEGRRRSGHAFALDGLQALRVYLREASALKDVQSRLAAIGLPLDRIAFLQGDICRRELEIEIEGVFAPG